MARSDVDEWSRLTHHLAAADDHDETYAPEDLDEEFDSPRFDPTTDAIGVFDEERLVAYGACYRSEALLTDTGYEGRVRVHQDGGVATTHRRTGIGRALFDWTERRAAELAAAHFPGAGLVLSANGLTEGSAVSRLLAHRAYEPVRYFTDMRLTLADWIDPGTPTRSVPFTSDRSEATMRAHHEAFADHWGAAPGTPETWAWMTASRVFRPQHSRIVVAPDGEVDAYAIGSEWSPGELYVDILGTRRRSRGQGLGRDVLLAVIRGARDAGMTVVDLGVDASSPTGANRLYESVGFRPLRTHARWWRTVPAPTGQT